MAFATLASLLKDDQFMWLKISLIFFSFFASFAGINGQTEFDNGQNKPWQNKSRALVLDGRYYNFSSINWKELKKDKRVAGIILRSTGAHKDEKTGKWSVIADSQYPGLRKLGRENGYLWGSYHVGAAENIMSAVDQADLYVNNIDRDEDEVIALDLENIWLPHYMNLDGAKKFIERVFERTGRYPLVYVTAAIHAAAIQQEGQDINSVFAKTPLWIVRPEDNIEGCLKKATRWWNTYVLWQIASEVNCKKTAETYCELPRKRKTVCPYKQLNGLARFAPETGVKIDMDVDIYNGTVEQLREAWPFTFKVKKPQ
jgi:hypothetical protein